jgi:predicted HicB family RNase H-like nuclease
MADKFDKVAYNNKYNASKYDSLRIVVPKGKKDKIKAYAESKGESINRFVNKAIDEAMNK